jgi:dipeptidase D
LTGVEVRVSGARGGHSGADIASGRANANKVLGRILEQAAASAPLRIVLLEGGVSRNAIPREARAVLGVALDDLDDFRRAASTEFDGIRRAFSAADPDLALEFAPSPLPYTADDTSTAALVRLLADLPTGVIAMHPDHPDVVETSTSLTVVETDVEFDCVSFGSMTRSSNAAALDEAEASITEIAQKAGAEVEVRRSYPPWEPMPDSRLLDTARATYAQLFGVEPALTVVHGGLECAVLGQKLPGVEMVSIGPEVVGPHAPGEKLRFSSTQRFYRFLGALLEDLSR